MREMAKDSEGVVELSAGPIRYRQTGTGEPAVLVHGILSSSTLWDRVLPDLGRRLSCFAPDWPLGSHPRAMHPGADLSPPALADLVVEFCDRLGLGQVTLVGNDTGGAICQLVAARHPTRVRRLVLTPCDAYDNFPPTKVFWVLNLAARTPGGLWVTAQTMRLRAAQRLPIAFGHLARHPIPSETVAGWFEPVRHDRRVRADLVKVIKALSSRYTLEAAGALETLEAPALIVWSPQDRVFPFDHARRLAASIPDARLEVVEDSYGFVPLDQPGRLADAIARFVEETA